MIDWIKKKMASRYVKSIIRYLIAAAIGVLSTQIDLPSMPHVQEFVVYVQGALVEFLGTNKEQLAELLTAILMAWLTTWTVAKNRANAKVEEKFKIRVK